MSVIWMVCAGLLAVFPALFAASRRETVPQRIAEKRSGKGTHKRAGKGKKNSVLLLFDRAAVYLLRLAGRIRQRSGRTGFRPSVLTGRREETMQRLRKLDPSADRNAAEISYYTEKLSKVLLLLFLAAAAGLAAESAAVLNRTGAGNGEVERPGFDQSASESSYHAYAGEEDLGTVDVVTEPQAYTQQETERLAEQVFAALGNEIPQGAVTENLYLPETLEGYPFRIQWESSDYSVLSSDGTLEQAAIPEGRQIPVTLVATLLYRDYNYSREFSVFCAAKPKTPEEQFRSDLQQAVQEKERTTAEKPSFLLPAEVDGKSIRWTPENSLNGRVLFFLLLAAAAGSWFAADSELRDRIHKREQQLRAAYPQMVSRLALFVGAGMSVRSSFLRIGETYEESRKGGGKENAASEEILILCRELENGVSETAALEQFGRRCGLLEYSRFCSLLVQNMHKGNTRLQTSLREEAEEAFEERKNIARQLGEEAGTKLLFPMILLIIVTMVIVIIPAWNSFAM